MGIEEHHFTAEKGALSINFFVSHLMLMIFATPQWAQV